MITQATAKGNLNIIATEGSINSQGAQLSAEGDALLHAKENINLNVAQSHSEQTVDRKQSGFSIDNRDWAAPAGTFKTKIKVMGVIHKLQELSYRWAEKQRYKLSKAILML